jgi:hypothetical protein
MSPISPKIIINAAKRILNLPSVRNSTLDWHWKSTFGYNTMPAGVNQKHILWALLFLTVC